MACRFDTSGGGAPLDGDTDGGPSAFDADPLAPDGAGPVDAGPNAPDAEACGWSYTPALFDPCSSSRPDPGGVLVLSIPGTYVYDTDTTTLTDPEDGVTVPVSSDLGGVRAIWVDDFAVESAVTLRVEGSAPLLVVSERDIDVVGTVDASSYFDIDAEGYAGGAGADPAACPAMPPEPGRTCAQHGGSGGGAGAFGGDGGDGGEGGDTRDCGGAFSDGIPGGAGGVALAVAPTVLRGGCGGRDGAPNNSGASSYGAGGPGGGAVHLAARDVLTISGTVHAGGAGGGPGIDDRSGGGGGGSGGLIGLEAATVQLTSTAVVAANGGGGGGGCDNGAAGRGGDGAPGMAPAAGGTEQGNGGPGGAGGAGSTPDGTSAAIAERGGGGGGGGAGFVILYGPGAPVIDSGAVISPGAVVK